MHESRRSIVRFAVATSSSFLFGLALSACVLGQEATTPPKDKAPTPPGKQETAKATSDKVGPQVGDQIPALNLRNLKGEPQRLGDAWRGGPALLVTSSFTCPKSRSRWPELKAIVDRYGDKLNVVIVYVIEAHPVGSICPYKGVEDVTPENERDGILRRQPAKLEQRLELAEEFKRYLRVNTPIYVDTVNNQAWKAFAASPNIGLLVDAKGIVAARETWFDGPRMQAAIDKHLRASDRPRPETGRDEEKTGETALIKAGLKSYDLRSIIQDKDAAKLAKVLKEVPALANYVFSSERGHSAATTALMEAVKDGNLAAAELLISYGADVNGRTSDVNSALQLAGQAGELKMIKLLLRNHANLNFPRTGKTPLHEAALAGRPEAARLLIDAGAQKDLYSDIALGDIVAIQKALAADPSLALRPDGAGRMPLDYAAGNGQVDIAGLLLKSGAPVVDELRTSMDIPLHRAIHRRDARMVKLLLDAGSSPDTSGGWGEESYYSTPALHLAVHVGNREIVQLLLAHKVDLRVRNIYSQTALHVAATEGQAELAELLIQAGADVNAPQLSFIVPCGSGEEATPPKNTPLHFAAARGNPRTIAVLVKGGAKLEARNVYGRTPLMAAVEPPLYTGVDEKSQLKNIDALIDAGADVNAQDNQGRTILDAVLELERPDNEARNERKRLQDLIDLLKKHGARRGEVKSKK
jgi:ankyrin repeat protein